MADPAVAGVVEGDLDDELGAQRDPLQVLLALPPARVAVPAMAGLVRRQLGHQRALLGGSQPGGVPDDVQRPVGVVETEDQRADGALVLARPVAGDHRVDRPHPLDLHHALALARTVGGAQVLGHDPLAVREPWSGAVRIDGERRQHQAERRQLLEPCAAIPERRRQQRFVVAGQQVERDEVGRRLLRQQRDPRRGRVDPLLQRAEVLLSVGGVDHDLPVDDVPARREGELGEVAPERLGAARLDQHLVSVDEHDRPEAVELGLIRPVLAQRQLLAGARQLGVDRRCQRQRHRRRW